MTVLKEKYDEEMLNTTAIYLLSIEFVDFSNAEADLQTNGIV